MKRKGFADYELLPKIAVIGIILGVGIIPLKYCRDSVYDQFYNKVEAHAIAQLGDRKAPLTEAERKEWYGVMGIKLNERPTVEQLENFIESNK